MATRTRSGRVSKAPERLEIIEDVEDDYTDDDDDYLEDDSDFESESDEESDGEGEDDEEADENGNLRGFIVDDESDTEE